MTGVAEGKQHGVFYTTIRQQLSGRAGGLAVEALEHIGADRRATVVLRLDGDKITYGIGGPKLAWDDVIVLGTINMTPLP